MRKQKPTKPDNRLSKALIAAAIILVTIAAFRPVIRSEFVNNDDIDYVTKNPHVQSKIFLKEIKTQAMFLTG